MPDPVRLIVNPSAGGGRAGRVAPDAERELRALGLEVSRADTTSLEHARELGVQAASEHRTVVALSGDGMIGALADALRSVPGAVLGVIPGGRGNDLARVLEIPDDPAGAAAVIAGGHTRAVDLGIVDGAGPGDRETAFVGIASVGFDSDANRIANEAPARLGGLVYAYGALRALASWREARFELELAGGERRSFTGYSVAAANSKAYGGGMHLAPDALLDDGLLEVVVIRHVSKLRFLANLPKVFSGAHVGEPSVHVMRSEAIKVSADRPFTMYADGDPIGELPVTVRALAGAVTMLVPGGSSQAFATSEGAARSPGP
jgi:YegS/Rv2252/BmrU family lipid kinase